MAKQTNETTPVPVLVSWSSGKDSAWALHTLRQQPEHYDVRGIFTYGGTV
jgi:diphthamide synthase (EF-2-diphthine--ammonia ligase)